MCLEKGYNSMPLDLLGTPFHKAMKVTILFLLCLIFFIFRHGLNSPLSFFLKLICIFILILRVERGHRQRSRVVAPRLWRLLASWWLKTVLYFLSPFLWINSLHHWLFIDFDCWIFNFLYMLQQLLFSDSSGRAKWFN